MARERGTNEQRLGSILETVPDIIYRLNTRGKITFVNDAVKKYGYSIQELVGTSILDIVHPEDKKRAANRINERRTGDRSTKSLEIRLFTKKHAVDQSEVVSRSVENDTPFLITAEGLYDSETPKTKGFMGTQGIARDVTELKLAEERNKQQTEFLNLVLESLPHPFYVIDAFDYTIKLANSAAQLSILSKQSTCYAITHNRHGPCGTEEHPCPVEIIKRTKQPVTVEHLHYDKDGNPLNVEINAYPIFDNEGNVTHVIESSVDITERKRAEEEREKLLLDLKDALERVKTLSGLLPICSACKKIRDDKGYWNQIESYIRDHSEADFTHSICPECSKKLYGEFLPKTRETTPRP